MCVQVSEIQKKMQRDCYYGRFNAKTASRIFGSNVDLISPRDFGTTRILHLLFSLSTEISAV